LELTDGKTILRGLEYEPINNLDRDKTLPGAKVMMFFLFLLITFFVIVL